MKSTLSSLSLRPTVKMSALAVGEAGRVGTTVVVRGLGDRWVVVYPAEKFGDYCSFTAASTNNVEKLLPGESITLEF